MSQTAAVVFKLSDLKSVLEVAKKWQKDSSLGNTTRHVSGHTYEMTK